MKTYLEEDAVRVINMDLDDEESDMVVVKGELILVPETKHKPAHWLHGDSGFWVLAK